MLITKSLAGLSAGSAIWLECDKCKRMEALAVEPCNSAEPEVWGTVPA
jgi:hypothetical protein